MKKTYIKIKEIPAILWGEPADGVYLYVHGKLGHKEEAEDFAAIACSEGWQVLSIDLPGHGERKTQPGGFDPWHVVPELIAVMAYLKERWSRVALRANSIGAWFALLSFGDRPLERCLLVSPVLDMAQLIENMMGWAGVSQEQLQREGTIETAFDETLSWRYLAFAREHEITRWNHPTAILAGGQDNLTARSTLESFAQRFDCRLTVIERGEHWLHSPEELAALAQWTQKMVGEKA